MNPEIARLVRAEMSGVPVERHDAREGLPLTVCGFGAEEVLGALDSLLSTRVTMGAKTAAFEHDWAAYCGQAHGVMVNSGSSANLLLLAALVETGRLRPGDEVIVPAVAWSTSLFPIAQAGLVPVVVDVDPATLNLDVDAALEAMGPRTRAVLAVHLLGCPSPLRRLRDAGLLVLEDACGAHGAVVEGRRAGGHGLASSFSFFFSHHLTTIEGGMVLTSDDALADALRSLRAHGWIRERTDRAALADASPEIDPRFLFVSAGYNLRPTEVQAAFGLAQLPRLDEWVARRRANHRDWCRRLADIPGITVFPEPPDSVHAGFAFPMLVDGDRAAFMRHLEASGVQTRPISGSNLARQPAFRHVPARVFGDLPVADRVHTNGLFVGNSHAFGTAHGDLLERVLGAAPASVRSQS